MGSSGVTPKFEIAPPEQPAQPRAQFEIAPPDQPQSWLDTAGQYALSAGHFLRNMLPHPDAPPSLPASNAADWAKLTAEQKQAYTKQLTDWQVKQAGQSGNIAFGFLTPGATGMADTAAQKGGGWLADKAASLYQKALRPSTTIAPSKVAAAVQTGIENRIPVSAGGLEKLGALVDDLNSKITAEIKSTPGRTINPAGAVSNLNKLTSKFANQVNPRSDLEAIRSAGNEFLDQFRSAPGQAVRNIPAEQAQAMKVGTYQQLGSKAYGELQTATKEAQKALARGLKDELEKAFPELANLNAKESQLLRLEPMLETAVKRAANRNLIGIGAPIATGATKAVTGSGGLAAAVGAIKAVFDQPSVSSRVAFALDRAAQGKGIVGATGRLRLQGWLNALARGALANNQAPSDQTSQ